VASLKNYDSVQDAEQAQPARCTAIFPPGDAAKDATAYRVE
jgi:hypothetical protein